MRRGESLPASVLAERKKEDGGESIIGPARSADRQTQKRRSSVKEKRVDGIDGKGEK